MPRDPDLAFNYQEPRLSQMFATARDYEFRMPPVGISETRYTASGMRYKKYTVRCGVEGCWYVVLTSPSPEHCEALMEDHKVGRNFQPPCPAPPRRESLPTGHSFVEKLWAEIDDVTECMFTQQNYRDMDDLKSYARGLAFSIVMLDTTHFQDVNSVSREAVRRRKMRLGEIPYEPTPTSTRWGARFWETLGLVADGPVDPGNTPSNRPSVPVAARSGARRLPSRVAPKPAPMPALDAKQIAAIKAGVASGTVTAAQIAQVYGLTEAQVMGIVNPPPVLLGSL